MKTLEQGCEICSKLTIKTPERRHWRHKQENEASDQPAEQPSSKGTILILKMHRFYTKIGHFQLRIRCFIFYPGFWVKLFSYSD